jgi:K+-transporting ATPase A subunit
MHVHLKLARPFETMTIFDIWIQRVVMFIIATSYVIVFSSLIVHKTERAQFINAILLSAILFSVLIFGLSFVTECYTKGWCYDF